MKRLIGTREARAKLTRALIDAERVRVENGDDPRYLASQRRIRTAEAELPPLGRWLAREQSR